MEERRRYKRWQIEKSVQCRFQRNTQNCFLKEISYKGVSISLKATQIDLGKSCALTIAIVNELEPLNISCDIVWQRNINNNLELGLYFTRIKDRDKERIFRYVFDHFPEQILKQWWQGVK